MQHLAGRMGPLGVSKVTMCVLFDLFNSCSWPGDSEWVQPSKRFRRFLFLFSNRIVLRSEENQFSSVAFARIRDVQIAIKLTDYPRNEWTFPVYYAFTSYVLIDCPRVFILISGVQITVMLMYK